MARSRSKSRGRSRVGSPNANRRLRNGRKRLYLNDRLLGISQENRSRAKVAREVEDRRTWHPEGKKRPVRDWSGRRHRLQAVEASRPKQKARQQAVKYGPPSIGFVSPERLLLCARRKARRQVLLALGRGGYGGRKKNKWKEYSNVRC